jgi:uncharacterized protein YjbI with pentapeptide repeats
MANPDHLKTLQQGVDVWNAWRKQHPVEPDLSEATLSMRDLRRANLRGANLRGAELSGANLAAADLIKADLSEADLGGASLRGAHLRGANLREADLRLATLINADLTGANLREVDLRGANLIGANLSCANLSWAKLSGADLTYASLVEVDIANADLTGCSIYGVSAWGLKLSDETKQQNLIITRLGESEITVDNIEVAQFIYLLLNNQKIREVIDTITSKAVLILGRFTPVRKQVLDALRDELRKRNYLPIVFDFDKPVGRDITETVSLLARMARFVVADITDAKSIPQELGIIVPHLPSVPVQPLLLEGSDEYSMFEHFRRYPWVLNPYRYKSQEELIGNLADRVICPARGQSSGDPRADVPKANLIRSARLAILHPAYGRRNSQIPIKARMSAIHPVPTFIPSRTRVRCRGTLTRSPPPRLTAGIR